MFISFEALSPLLLVISLINFACLTIIVASQCANNSSHKSTPNHKHRFRFLKHRKSQSVEDISANNFNSEKLSPRHLVDKNAKKVSDISSKNEIRRKSSKSPPSFPSPPEPHFLMQQKCEYDDSDSLETFRSYKGDKVEVMKSSAGAQSKLEELLKTLENSQDMGIDHQKEIDPSSKNMATLLPELDMKSKNKNQINTKAMETVINLSKIGKQHSPLGLMKTPLNSENNLLITANPEGPSPPESLSPTILPEKFVLSTKISRNTLTKLEKLIESIEYSCRDQIRIESKAPGNNREGKIENSSFGGVAASSHGVADTLKHFNNSNYKLPS